MNVVNLTVSSAPSNSNALFIQTNDGTTWVPIYSYTFNGDCIFLIISSLIGKDSDLNLLSRGSYVSALGKVESGVVTWQDGSTTTIIDDNAQLKYSTGSLGTATWRLSITGNVVSVEVKGVDATTISWRGDFTTKIL